jgi:hypothetical protein
MSDNITGLALLRAPFPPNQISKLPKPTKAQTDAVKADYKVGNRCDICGAWHHPKVVHLDYVGHAALTDRLLDADPGWGWEPLSIGPNGLPVLDPMGGMWIRLTVCGVTRLGYGHAGEKSGGDAIKEVIGDALRNAAMRFGAALDLWHKGQLHADEDDSDKRPEPKTDANPKLTPDMSPKARAQRIMVGVAAGDAAGAALALYEMGDEQMMPIWEHLDARTTDKLIAAWPKVAE